MTIGVVTVTFNAAPYLRPFLSCCLAQQPGDFELLLIDNASSDASLAIAEEAHDGRVTVFGNTENIGYAAACNQGIRYFAEKGIENVLFINNDTEFNPNLFKSLLDHLNQHKADAVTPRITHFDEPTRDWYAGGRIVLWKGFQGAHLKSANAHGAGEAPSWTEVAPGCCVLFTMDTFRRVGLFDPTYFVYVEDTDLFIRMKRAGLRLLYIPDTTVAHKISLSTGGSQSDFSIRYHQRNQIYAVRKHYRPVTVVIQLIILFIKAGIRRLIGRDDSRQYRLRRVALREGLRLDILANELRLDVTRHQCPR